jgi:hypothetical protein
MCPKIPYLASCLPQAHGGCPKAPPPTQTLWRTVSPKQAAFGEKSRHHSEFAIEKQVCQTGKTVDSPQFWDFIFGEISRQTFWVVIWCRGLVTGTGPGAADDVSAKRGGWVSKGQTKRKKMRHFGGLQPYVKIHALIGSRRTNTKWIGFSCCADLHTKVSRAKPLVWGVLTHENCPNILLMSSGSTMSDARSVPWSLTWKPAGPAPTPHRE